MNIFMRKHTRTRGKKPPSPVQTNVDNTPLISSSENPRIKALSVPIRRVTALSSTRHEPQQSGGNNSPDQKQPHQQQQGLPGANEIKGKWKQQVGSAKIAWSRLTEDELLQSEGKSQKLAGLIQERYGIAFDEANSQVKTFFRKHVN